MIIRNNDYIIGRKLRIFLLSVRGNKKTQDNQYLQVSQDKNFMDVKLGAINQYKKQCSEIDVPKKFIWINNKPFFGQNLLLEEPVTLSVVAYIQ